MSVPLHRSLIRAILIYTIIFTVSTLMFGTMYFCVSKFFDLKTTTDYKESTFLEWIYFSVMVFFGAVDYDKIPSELKFLNIIQHFINSIIVPIISGIIFYYILSRPPNIYFSDKLIIRRRTSEGSDGTITLSLCVTNKDRTKVYNVNCQLIFVYYKLNDDGSVSRNGETNFTNSIPYIDNIYRFSFELNRFPSILFETIIERISLNLNDKFIVIISGKFGKFGDSFLIEKTYSVSDVEIAKDTKPLYIYNNPSTLERSPIVWSNINKLIYYTESEREKIIEYMRQVLSQRTSGTN